MMSHHPLKSPYYHLVTRLNAFPQGAPPSELLYRILSLLFTEKEADLVSRLPLRPVTATAAGRIWNLPATASRRIMENLAEKGMLLDLERDGEILYFLPPPMAGFFEFSLMRTRAGIDQKKLSGLLYEYLNVEEEFVRDLFRRGTTAIGRVLVNERSLENGEGSQILDYELASRIIATASSLAVGLCYCRHKMSHLGRNCPAPFDICMTLNDTAASLVRHGNARRIDAAEGLDILERARSLNLIQCADNVRKGVNFICHCCGCCCEPLLAARRLAVLEPVFTTNFIPQQGKGECSGCGRCVDACPVEAMVLVSANDFRDCSRRKARLDKEKCLGCGVCVRVCSRSALRLVRRQQRVITPVNSAHRVVLMAIERGMLAALIFDNRAHLSHRAMGAILGALLKLPPVKRIMASRQVKSRYLDRLLSDIDISDMPRKN